MNYFQSLLGNNSALIGMGQLGTISSDINKMANPEKFYKPKVKVSNETKGTPGLKYDPRSGTMIGENAPEGFKRGLYGFFDWFGGDMDQRGHGSGVESEGGYGGVAPKHKVKDGKVIEVPKEDPRSDIEKITGKDWDKYMQSQKDLLLDVGKKKFEQEQLARMPDLMHAAGGGSFAAALAPGMSNLAQIASNSRAYQFNSPAIRSSAINFASLLG